MSETLTLIANIFKIIVNLIVICIIAAVVYNRKSILEAIEGIIKEKYPASAAGGRTSFHGDR